MSWRVTRCGIVAGELTVREKKKSSPEAFRTREKVGTAVYRGSSRYCRVQSTEAKCARASSGTRCVVRNLAMKSIWSLICSGSLEEGAMMERVQGWSVAASP